VTLEVDRNTTVFLENRLGSVHDLVVGTPVRASFGGDRRAVWVEVRSRATASGVGREGPPQPGPSGPGPVPGGSER
jgi:hypothetical protein